MERYYGHKPVNIVLLDYTKEKNNLLNRHFRICRQNNEIPLWDEVQKDLLHFFSSNLLEKRYYYYADRIVKWLFGTHDTEEFNELRRSLTKLEIDGRLFSNYRDHTNHTLLVFMLGSYLYEKLDKFREFYRLQYIRDQKLGIDISASRELLRQIDDTFTFDWLYVSLLHDVGYTFSDLEEENKRNINPLVPRAIWILEAFFNQYSRFWYEPEESSEIEQDVIDLHYALNMRIEIPKR